MIDNYTIQQHSHRFAAWAASRAASTSKLCRFRVKDGVSWLEACGLSHEFTIDHIPTSIEFDGWHKELRKIIVTKAKRKHPAFSHGIGAKLINVYMKSRFVCSGHIENPRTNAIHPPIDSVLLQALSDYNVGGYGKQWLRFKNDGWSKYDSPKYESVIKLISNVLGEKPLWMIEYYWKGYQD